MNALISRFSAVNKSELNATRSEHFAWQFELKIREKNNSNKYEQPAFTRKPH